MKETMNTTNQQLYSENKEVKIGNTIYEVETVFKGKQTLKQILHDWVVNTAIKSINN